MPSAVALRYARALADAALDRQAKQQMGDPRSLTAELTGFCALLEQTPELRILFSTPAIPTAKKKTVLADLAPLAGLSPLSRNFLSVVLDHDRMPLLREIAAAFEDILDERLGIIEAEITAARPLEP